MQNQQEKLRRNCHKYTTSVVIHEDAPVFLIAIKAEVPSQPVRQIKKNKDYDLTILCPKFQFSKMLVQYKEEYIHFLFKWVYFLSNFAEELESFA